LVSDARGKVDAKDFLRKEGEKVASGLLTREGAVAALVQLLL